VEKAGESSVIILSDGTNEHEALIHEIDIHPVTGVPRHADFYVIEKGKKIQVKVPLEFIGVSPAVKDLGGILVKVLRELEIEAAAKDLPHDLKVDISALKELTSTIHVSDLKIPAGVTVVGTLTKWCIYFRSKRRSRGSSSPYRHVSYRSRKEGQGREGG